jgi:hypothetical protein
MKKTERTDLLLVPTARAMFGMAVGASFCHGGKRIEFDAPAAALQRGVS